MTDGYKIKRILIWQGGVEKQIYPAPFQYTYDFRNKTIQNLTNDGWTNVSSATVNANGITFSGWTAIFNQISGLGDAMASANKLKIEMLSNNVLGAPQLGGVTLVQGTNANTQTGFYVQSNLYEAMCGYTRVAYNTLSSPSGEYTVTCEFDFANKTFSFNYPGVYSGTGTLSDSSIATAKTCNNIRIPIQNRYIEKISINIY